MHTLVDIYRKRKNNNLCKFENLYIRIWRFISTKDGLKRLYDWNGFSGSMATFTYDKLNSHWFEKSLSYKTKEPNFL